PHRHPGAQIVAEILHDVAIARERRRAVRDRRPAAAEDRQVGVGPGADPGMAVEKERMAEDRPGAEDAERLGPLLRGLAVPADHLAHFADALRDVHGEGEATLLR